MDRNKHSEIMILRISTFLSFFIFLIGSDASPRVDPLVNTNLGLIRGVRASDGDYAMFMGIPYGKVNASNPFGKAIPQEPFEGTFEANDDSAICPQIEEFNRTITGSLDCLHLNVYVPTKANTQNPVPVLVWIYGGGFSIGFAGRTLYGPKYLVRHDVILVTLNYRLGPYGFMCLDTPEVPGNEGFKDQLLALRWIKNNIQAFGGDPNKITLFGESAGGISVDFQLLSQHEKLFDRVILQSGTSLLPIYSVPIKEAPLTLAGHLGLNTTDMNEATSFLSTVDTHSIIRATTELNLSFKTLCVEKEFEGVERFISEDWVRAPIPKAKKMPILLGFNEDEKISSYFGNSIGPFESFDVFNTKLNMGFNISHPDFDGMEELMKRYYLGDEEVSSEQLRAIADFDSDFTYGHPVYRSIAKYLDHGAGDIYLYMFSYVGDQNFVRRRNNITVGGATHADEIGYLFDVSIFNETPNEKDQLMIDRITTLWTNFAKFGNPTPETSELLPLPWTPIKKNTPYYYMNLGSELLLGTRPYHQRMSFWDLFYKANNDLQIHHPERN